MKRSGRIRARSRTKHKPSALRPDKRVRLTWQEYINLKVAKVAEQNWRCGNESCQECISLYSAELHHVKFRSQGGTDSADNTIALCSKCHRKRHGIGPKVVPAK